MVVNRIVLCDRPNLNDQIIEATLRFSDGSSLDTGALPNDGSGLSLEFDAKNVTSVQLSISGVSAATLSPGLAEIEVYGYRANRSPTADAGAARTVFAGAAATLDGSASSDLDGDSLTYAWRQTDGPSVTLSDAAAAAPTFTAPAGGARLTFELVVSDGRLGSAPAGVTVTVLPIDDRNIAAEAIVVASSQNASNGQLAIKAVDGVLSGWPRDSTREWATRRTRAGSWLKLVWQRPMVVSSVVLCDRPNPRDRVIAATLRFSDGSKLSTGALPNNGKRLTLTFAAKTLTSVQFKVSRVSSTTVSAGLAEIEVFGHDL
jgi:hypothetical protein